MTSTLNPDWRLLPLRPGQKYPVLRYTTTDLSKTMFAYDNKVFRLETLRAWGLPSDIEALLPHEPDFGWKRKASGSVEALVDEHGTATLAIAEWEYGEWPSILYGDPI